MTSKIAFLSAVAATALCLTGCAMTESGLSAQSLASTPSLAEPPPGLRQGGDISSLVYLAAQTLADRAEGLSRTRPVVVTTIASVDDLDSSSTFGRLASEMIANRMQQRGYVVREAAYTRMLTANREGILTLSRNASDILRPINAQAVVAGTYAVAGRMIYLSLRLLNADNGQLLSSTDVAIPRNENTDALLYGGSGMVSLSRFEDRSGLADR